MDIFVVQETRIELQHTAGPVRQHIRIEATPWGTQLAQLLGVPQRQGDPHWLLEHTPALDLRLRSLTDLLIALRYRHPTLLQLECTRLPPRR